MKLGTMQCVLAEPLETVFPVAKSLGFEGVELDWFQLEDARTGSLAAPQRGAIRRAATEAGVEIPSVAAHFMNGGGIASPETDARESGVDAVKTGLELCHELGAKVLLIPFFGAAEIVDEEGQKYLVENLQTLAPIAQSAGVKLGVEGALRGDVTARLLDEVGSSFVGSYWDMANCLSIGFDPLEEVQALQSHIVQVHAKEFHGQPRTQLRDYPNLNTVPFGQGQVPVRDVLKKLQSVGYDGYVVLETGTFDNAQQSAVDALRVLQSALVEI